MSKLIPGNIYKTIEYRLHTYEAMKMRICDWESSIYTQNKTPQLTQNQGFYSDPTALTVVKMLNPPKDIKEDICWVYLIDKAKIYCFESGISALFDVWYGQPKQSIISAATKIPCDIRTFQRWRDRLVFWITARATQHKLVKFE